MIRLAFETAACLVVGVLFYVSLLASAEPLSPYCLEPEPACPSGTVAVCVCADPYDWGTCHWTCQGR